MVVLLDSGHNEKTAGKRSLDGKILEWEYTWRIAEKVRERLLARKGLQVFHLDSDSHALGGSDNAELNARIKIANSLWSIYSKYGEQTILVSIHLNASENKDARGATVHIYDHAGTWSQLLGSHIDAAVGIWGLRGNRAKGPYRDNFAILRQTSFPAVLVECAFMTNPDDEEMLLSEEGFDKIVSMLSSAIYSFAGSC